MGTGAPILKVPKLDRHVNGSARVRLCGHTIYLGRFGSPEAQLEYDRIIGMYLASGRRWPPIEGAAPLPSLAPTEAPNTVEELGGLFLEHLLATMPKGRHNTTYRHARRALNLLLRSTAGICAIDDFGPRRLTAYQAWLTGHPDQMWGRKTINEYTDQVVSMFRWAVAQQFAGVDTWRSLQAVPALRRGRTPAKGGRPAREGRKVRPPDPAAIEGAKAHLPPMLRAMVELQLFSGMRPNELCSLRPMDLAKTEVRGVFAYHVQDDEANKNSWRDIDRTVYIGPRGMAILKPWMNIAPHEYVFSPARSEALRNAERRAARGNPRWKSHDPELRRKRRKQRPAGWKDRYDPEAYGKAVSRACDAMNEARTEKGKPLLPRWTPYQLRHAAASAITAGESLEVAQILLGHRSIQTTMNYVEVKGPRAAKAARKLG
jgi:integrase